VASRRGELLAKLPPELFRVPDRVAVAIVIEGPSPVEGIPVASEVVTLPGKAAKNQFESMELDLQGVHADRAYPLLASLVVPRPIAWVTTLNADGVVNAAPFSFFNVLGADPPIVGFCPGDRDDGTPKDTARNVRAMHEFVVNLVDEAVAEAMNRTAASFPFGVSELEAAGLHAALSTSVRPPRISESPASLECSEWGTLQIGDNRLIIGVVKRVHVRDDLIDAERLRIRSDRFAAVGRMASPHWYCRTTDRFEMIRPE
jgi:flavin reductase (DIM6/NTAB) family NADH-FMN oxidoreductase RutF